MIHIAGNNVQVNQLLRQRCAWCGFMLIDYDLDRVAVPVGQVGQAPAIWPVGALVEIDGNASWVVYYDEQQLPPNACMREG